MTQELFGYLTDYIRENYPIYFMKDKQAEFMSFVNMIALDFSFKEKLGGRSIKDVQDIEELNNTIDVLVEKYAQIKFTSQWANFNTFCNYIKKVIYDKNNNKVKLDDKLVDNIIRDIALYIVSTNELDYDYYMNGSYDDILYSHYLTRYEKMNNDCYKYIGEVIKKSDIKVNLDELTFNQLLEKISSSVLSNYELFNISNGVHDDDIIKRYKFYLKQCKFAVNGYVRNFVEDIVPLVGIPVDLVVNDIINMTFKTKEMSAFKILNGEMDQEIEKYAEKKRKENDPDRAKGHIRKLISRMNSSKLSDEDLDDEAIDILNSLHKEYNYLYIDISDGKYDDQISQIFITNMMKYSSVKNDKVPDKIKYDPKKKKMSKTQKMLMIIAILATLGFGAVTITVVDHIVDDISQVASDVANIGVEKAVDDFDGFDYSYIFTKETDAYTPLAKNVLNFYSKLVESGYNGGDYDYLGFYRAYMHVADDRLQIMDSMLNFVQINAAGNEKYVDFYEEIKYKSCYLDFVYDQLESLGYTEITEDKYQKALKAYESAMFEYPGEEPIKKISKEDREVVEEVMAVYREYSKKLQLEFGNLISDGYNMGGI